MTLGRGFLFSDDCAGAVISFNGSGVTIPFIWVRPYEDGIGSDENEVDFFGVAPVFNAGGVSISPYFLYATSDHINVWNPTTHTPIEGIEGIDNDIIKLKEFDEMDVYYAGLDVNATVGIASLWLTGIYQGGTVKSIASPQAETDIKAYLGGAGFNVDFGGADIHGQGFYATGHDSTSDDIEAFFCPFTKRLDRSVILLV